MSSLESPAGAPRRMRQRAIGLLCLTAVMLPFVYLTSVSLLLSAYVHNWPFPSRGFLRLYAIPSNALVRLPAVGRLYSGYCGFCVTLFGGDHESMRTDGNR